MEFESPDVAKDFPGLFTSNSTKRSESDYSDEEKVSRIDLLSKRKEKKESKKDKGYKVFEGESSGEDARSPGKTKKIKTSFKFPGKEKKEKHYKGKDKEGKDKKEEKEKVCKKESKEYKKENKESKKEIRKDSKDIEKIKVKKKKESKILKMKDKKKKNFDQEAKEEKPIFGVPLHVAVDRSKSHDGINVPVIVRECIDYIEEHGLTCEGIYRISGLKSKVRQLKEQYNRCEKVYLYEHEPHIVASLLKQFLRDLPEPILTVELIPKFEEAAALKDTKKQVEILRNLLQELPTCNYLLLSWVIVHMLHIVTLEKRNKMNLQNVYIVLSPTLQISHNILEALFVNSEVLFSGVILKKYVPPIGLDSNRLSLELPDSPSAISAELSKQENFLNVIHAELNAGLRDQQKEEQLWEIQRVVTQLKRKLRFLRQVQDSCEMTESKDCPPQIASVQQNAQSTTEDNPQLSPCDKDESEYKDDGENEEIHPTTEEITEGEKIDSTPSDCKETEESNCSIPQDITHSPKNTILFNSFPLKKYPAKSEILDTSPDEIGCLEEKIKSDELLLLSDELRKKIISEKQEISRLRVEIEECERFYKFKKYSFESPENSSSDSGEDSSSSYGDADEDLPEVLQDIIRENQDIKEKNVELLKQIEFERDRILNAKVEVKLLMQNRLLHSEEHLI